MSGEIPPNEELPARHTSKHPKQGEETAPATDKVKHQKAEEHRKETVPNKHAAKHHVKAAEPHKENHPTRQKTAESRRESLPAKHTVKHQWKRRESLLKRVAAKGMWRLFAYNLFLGLVLLGVAILLARTGTGEELANGGFDLLTTLESAWYSDKGLALSDAPVYFILMTHDDQERSNDQERTSREKLARIVEAAREKEADVIVVDVLLEQHATGDDALRKAFGNFTGHRQLGGASKVILPVEIDHDGNIKATIFDDLITRYPEIFWRGLAYIEATGSSAVVRYWTPYRMAKAADGKEEAVWGIPALAAAMTAEKDRTLPMEEKEYVFSQRIRYRLMPESRSTLRITMPAAELLSGRSNPLPSLKGKTVLISNISPDMADIHRTPVGELPGVYILGNAINSVLYGLRAPILPRSVEVVFQVFAILVAAVAFTRYTSARAYVITVTVYATTLLPLGCLMYLRQGDLYQFMLPVVGMKLRMTLSGYLETFKRWRTKYRKLRASYHRLRTAYLKTPDRRGKGK